MRLVPITELYAKLVDEYPMQEELNEIQTIRFVKEALKKIDDYAQWEKKRLKVNIKEYRTVIPEDYYSLDHTEGNHQVREQGEHLYFSMRNGSTTLHYLAMPLDEEHRPLIPATEEYLDALMHYVASKFYKNESWLPSQAKNEVTEYEKWLDKKKEARGDARLRRLNEFGPQAADDFHNLTPHYRYSPTRRRR